MVDFVQAGKPSYHNARSDSHVSFRGAQGVFSDGNTPGISSPKSKISHLLEREFDMELTYVTENTIVLCFPDNGSEVTYRQNAKEVSDMLRAKHSTKYAIVNLSGVSRILSQNNPQVYEYGFPPHLAPPLEELCGICRTVANWLQSSRDHVVVFHCKGGIDRLACVLAAYINYSSIYDGQSEALNRFAMKQFFEEQLAKWLQPSQARYVQYFTQLLTGNISIRRDAVYLQHIMLHGVPQGSDVRPSHIFAKVYANMKPVYTSHALKITPGQSRACISLSKPLELCGDILIKLFSKHTGSATLLCRAQLNASTLHSQRISLRKGELDVAAAASGFAEDGKLELIFCTPDSQTSVCSEDFSHESDTLNRWNSYSDFNSVSDDSPLDSPSGTRKSVRISRYFEEGPLEDSLYNQTHMTSYSAMPVQTNGGVYPGAIPGNEYGITNVSSHGRVNITVIPPNKMGRQLSPADFRGSPSDSSSPYGTHQQQRYFSNSSSPRSPPLTSGTYNGNNSNNVNSSTVTSRRTIQSSTEYNPPANRGGQHRQLPAPQSAVASAPSGKEQNDLDDILRELLGETYTSPSPTTTSSTTTTTINNNQLVGDDAFIRERQQYTNPDGSTTTIEKRKYKAPNVTENVTINKTSSRKVHTSSSQNGSASPDIDRSGVSWLQEQQNKLNQRQRTRDDVDTSQRQEVVRELKTVVDRRGFSSSDSELGDGQTYYSQKDIIVNQQPIAYTVLIKPEEEKRRQEELRQQNETNLTKKSVTNVSHTHHTHYNFKDADDGSANGSTDSSYMLQTLEEQRNKIRQLEDELRNVKLGLQQTTTIHRHEEERKVETKPPRPPKQEMEEEEILSFKPVGIASLESGTGATLPRVIPGPAPTSACYEEEETISFKPIGVNTLESGSGQSYINTNTMRSGSEGRTMGGAHNGVGMINPGMGGANYCAGTLRSQPQSRSHHVHFDGFGKESNSSSEAMSVVSYPPVFPPTPTTPYQVMSSPLSPMRSLSWRDQGQASLTMRQLRQASLQGYNAIGRSHENLQGTLSSPYPNHHQHTGHRRETLRRYASANNLPFNNTAPAPIIQYRGSTANVSRPPVLRISGDFEDMWNRQHTAQHKPVFGREYGVSTAPQRVVTESRQVQQQSYSHGGQQMSGGNSPGVAYNQGNQQSMVNEDAMLGGQQHGTMNSGGGAQRYGYTASHSYNSGLNQQGGQMGTLPHNQALHVNTGENRYATVGGQQSHTTGGQGHVQFTNGNIAADQHSGMQSHHQHQSTAAAGLRSNIPGTAAPGYGQGYGHSGLSGSGGGGFAHGMGYNTAAATSVSHHTNAAQASSTMGGSRYNLHQAPPLSPGAASYHGASYYQAQQTGPPSVYHGVATGPPSVYHGGATLYGSRRGSMQSLVAASDVFGQFENGHVTAKFVKDTSKYWYKPTISRDEVINQLKDTVPGTFIVRDSSSFPGAFGLAVRVQQLPPNVQLKGGHDTSADYVRFYLIEPTSKGVKLKGCSNEPVFASLAALIYQHTITPLALPCKLLLPDPDRLTTFNCVMVDSVDGRMMNGDITSSANDLLKHGAACNVVYLNNVDTESLTGPQAVSKAVQQTFCKGNVDTTIATFKASSDGITVTDTHHRLFFRQHFPRDSVSFCGVDPADRRFTQSLENGMLIKEAKMFGFVAKKKKGGNHCLLFAELDPEQPASAVVNFVTKVMMSTK